jgi:hypothetical protein
VLRTTEKTPGRNPTHPLVVPHDLDELGGLAGGDGQVEVVEPDVTCGPEMKGGVGLGSVSGDLRGDLGCGGEAAGGSGSGDEIRADGIGYDDSEIGRGLEAVVALVALRGREDRRPMHCACASLTSCAARRSSMSSAERE